MGLPTAELKCSCASRWLVARMARAELSRVAVTLAWLLVLRWIYQKG